MEAKKITIACFVGGALCVAVALMCAPMFWWLGLLAGMAGGYLSYEFREVLRAIPIAWRKSRRGVSNWWLDTDKEIRKWFAESHPITYSYMIIFIIMTLATATIIEMKEPTGLEFRFWEIIESFLIVFIFATFTSFSSLPIFGLVVLLAFIGARIGEKCFWFPFSWIENKEAKKKAKQLQQAGYSKAALTRKNFSRWVVKGIALTILFFVWTMWKYLAIGIWLLLCFWGRSGWEFFKLIHSKKRVLCAIDGTIGGAMAFFCFASVSLTFPQQILVVFFGGLLGAVIGVLNYEIVSKRVLHLAPAVNNT